MSRNPVAVNPRDTVGQVIALMREHGISRLPIVDGDKLMGVLTMHDMIAKVIQPRERATRGEYAGESPRTLSHQVKDIMTPEVLVARPEESLRRPLGGCLRPMSPASWWFKIGGRSAY